VVRPSTPKGCRGRAGDKNTVGILRPHINRNSLRPPVGGDLLGACHHRLKKTSRGGHMFDEIPTVKEFVGIIGAVIGGWAVIVIIFSL